jgi:hypothetical protein
MGKLNEHYDSGNISVMDVMKSKFKEEDIQAFCILNAVKYLLRCEHKGQKEDDLFKCENYLHFARTGEWIKK